MELPPILDILPQPFAWIHIPAGQVTLTDIGGYLNKETTYAVSAYTLAKYPITHAQYSTFTGEDYLAGQDNHPVGGVNWHDALSFCTWLSKKTGLAITLPTEQQWQHAAQGNTAQKYPWGAEFDSQRCNTHESGIGTITPVTHYANGASPYGVMDMSGNVFEWCLTDFVTGSNDITHKNNNWRVLRGGSFYYDEYYATCAYRNFNDPYYWYNYFGFRVCIAASS